MESLAAKKSQIFPSGDGGNQNRTKRRVNIGKQMTTHWLYQLYKVIICPSCVYSLLSFPQIAKKRMQTKVNYDSLMLEGTQNYEKATLLQLPVPVTGKLNEHFSIKFHLVSFVHCPSVPLQEGEGSGNRGRPSGCLTEAFGWVATLPLWRPPGPLLSFPPSQTKWVKSTHLEGEAGEGCGGEL